MDPLRPLGPSMVRSPWSAPPPPRFDAPMPRTTDVVSLGATAPPAETAGARGRRLLLGVVTAASLIGGTIGATVATRAAVPAAETLQAERPGPAASMRATSSRVTERGAIIEGMLRPMSPEVAPSAADLQKARATLERLPATVLQLLGDNGTHIVILKPGQTPDDAGLVRPVEPASYHDAGLTARAREALTRIDRLYADRIGALQHEADTAPAFRQPIARQRLESLQTERSLVARRIVMEATDALLEPADLHVDADGRVAPSGLRALAEQHGARTPAEVREYTGLVERLNREPLAQVVVPAFQYSRDSDSGPSERLLSHDLESLEAWESEDATGQYFYRGDLNAVVVRADQLGAADAPHNVLRHELGHAFEDARRTLLPTPAYATQREAAFGRIATIPGHPYHGTHAAEGPDEMAAETFSNVMSGHDAALRRTDTAWLQAFGAWGQPAR